MLRANLRLFSYHKRKHLFLRQIPSLAPGHQDSHLLLGQPTPSAHSGLSTEPITLTRHSWFLKKNLSACSEAQGVWLRMTQGEPGESKDCCGFSSSWKGQMVLGMGPHLGPGLQTDVFALLLWLHRLSFSSLWDRMILQGAYFWIIPRGQKWGNERFGQTFFPQLSG
jgi:hypothetical protein